MEKWANKVKRKSMDADLQRISCVESYYKGMDNKIFK